jgi:hypothetical protein
MWAAESISTRSFPLDVENSTDPEEIAAKLERRGRQGTRMYDAVVAAADWLAKQEPSDKRKVIFVFSDGDDNASQISLQGAIAAVQRVQNSDHRGRSLGCRTQITRKSPEAVDDSYRRACVLLARQ